jgi:hypothetical protein
MTYIRDTAIPPHYVDAMFVSRFISTLLKYEFPQFLN